MNRPALALTCIAALGLVSAPLTAQGRERQRVSRVSSAPPLTVKQRSWLDSGNVVAVGSQNTYVTANTVLNQPIYSNFEPARFGQSTLPGQFDLAFSNENPRGPQAGGIFGAELP